MKTLQVNAGNETGGGRTLIINLLRALTDQGVDSQLLVFERGPVSDWAAKWDIPTTIMNQDGQLDLRVAGRLKKFINDNQIDVVNTHGPRANFIMGLIHKHVKAKWVATVHSDPYVDFADNLKGKVMTKLNINAFKKADLLTLVTARFQPILEQAGIESTKINPIFNAIYFRETPPQTQRQKIFTLVNIARLVPVKNQQLLLRALAQVDFDYRLQLVGNGPTEDQLKQLVQELQIQDRIDFIGFKDDTTPYYQNSDLFVLPSTSEGFPMVLLESANNGLPMIVSDTGSDAQVVHEDTGWVVAINDLEQLKQALVAAHESWQNDGLRTRGQKFYQYCATNFSSTRLAQTVMKIYEDVLK
ncbi:glycosyltransferase family 4 protein [Bombilactobacillus folatiphilus]|uniref:Glycosyltransferase family 4 protein n=1 Tax=Bombilactobacillus folatiphilus TaxID=2923362 RepID=A0ABY4P849_9LACO|nr:glycosyltransferase family 4 protein [Bombilactobacillus folatiphilus]UQS81837.1 glycosyltransferase family 4 protein [Bombilactobacillus folatiphilus]